jgi:hypothetical protein
MSGQNEQQKTKNTILLGQNEKQKCYIFGAKRTTKTKNKILQEPFCSGSVVFLSFFFIQTV